MPRSPFPTSGAAFFAAVADINSNRKPDLIATHSGGSSVTLLLGDGEGDFKPSLASPVELGNAAWEIVAADLNQDGNPDLAAANFYSHAPASTKNKHLTPREAQWRHANGFRNHILNKMIVLVLNRNWQAINVRTPQEAFCQMATNLATALEIEGENHIRPVSWYEWISLPNQRAEMKLVDTSSWIEYLRERNSSVGDRVEALVLANEAAWCDMTAVELWHGARGAR